MKRPPATHFFRFFPLFFLTIAALGIFERATALLDGEAFLAYGYEPATCALFAARGTATALCLFGACWLMWGRGRLAARLAVSVSLLATTLIFWHRLYDAELPWNAVSQHVSSVVTFLGATLLLACASRFGLGFVPTAGTQRRDLRQWQISILDLLLVTTGAAIILAAIRGHLPRDIFHWRLSDDEVLWIGMHVVSNLLIFATVIACFHGRRAWWVNVLLSSALSVTIAGMHVAALSRTRELPLVPVDAALLARGVHHLVDYAWLLAGLWTLHMACYRLCRVAPEAVPSVEGLRPERAAT